MASTEGGVLLDPKNLPDTYPDYTGWTADPNNQILPYDKLKEQSSFQLSVYGYTNGACTYRITSQSRDLLSNNPLYRVTGAKIADYLRDIGVISYKITGGRIHVDYKMMADGNVWSPTGTGSSNYDTYISLGIFKNPDFTGQIKATNRKINAHSSSSIQGIDLYLSLAELNSPEFYFALGFSCTVQPQPEYYNAPHIQIVNVEYALTATYKSGETCDITINPSEYKILPEDGTQYDYPQTVTFAIKGLQCSDITCGGLYYKSILKLNDRTIKYGSDKEYEADISQAGTYTNIFTVTGCSSSSKYDFQSQIILKQPKTSLQINGNLVSGEIAYVSIKNNTSIPITYSNTYGMAYGLWIEIDGNKHIQGTTNDKYTYNFTPSKSGTYSIRCGYNDVVSYDISLIVTGVLSGRPELYINDIHTNFKYRDGNVPITVPAYYQIQGYLIGIEGMDSGTKITVESDKKGQPDDIISVVQDTYNPSLFTITLKIVPNKPQEGKLHIIVNSWFNDYSSDIKGLLQAISRISIDRHQGEVGSECIFNCIGTSIIPLEDGTSIEGDYQWGIVNLSGQEITDYVITKGSKTSKEFSFYMTKAGVYDVVLKAYSKTYIQYTATLSKERITVSNIIDCSLPTQDRFAVILINDYNCVTIRRRNSSLLFNNLEFTSALNAIGKSKFNLYISDISANIPTSLLANNVKIVIVDGLTPVWSGTVDMIEEVNINTYDKVTFAKVYDIEASESTLQLSYKFMDNKDKGTVTGTVDELVSRILPSDWIGSVSKSKTAYTVSLDSTSRLQALETLTSQIGWKYRCRPDCPSYLMRIKVENRTYQVISGTAPQENDLVILYSGTMDTSGNLGIGLYYSFIADGSGHIRYTADTIPSDTYYGSVYHGFLIDYKPSYYQNYSPISVTVNEYAQNVSTMATSRDKYTEVSVYGVGYSGENLSSDIRLWMKINKDYTIDNAMYIVTSYDSSVSAINTLDNAIVNRYIWARYQITLTGWSFPLEPLANHKPTVFYRTSNGRTRKLELTSETGRIIPQRYQDQSKTAQTSIIVACIISKDDGSPLSPNDVNYKYYKDQDGRLLTDIIASFNPETNVCFNLCKLDNIPIKTDGTTLVKKGEYLLIGDTRVTVTDVYTNGWITFDWIYPEDTMYSNSYVKATETIVENRNPIPHGHLAGVLVMRDDSDLDHHVYDYTQYYPDPQSPIRKYNDMKITIQGAEGYSPMELERHACRIAQYGSNYDAQGSADIVYNVFRKSDYDVGCKKILTVGDRLTFNVATFRRLNVRGYDVRDFELIEYKVNCTQNRVSVNFGMPFVEVNDILYNMLSTSGMSVLPSTTEHVDEMFILHD